MKPTLLAVEDETALMSLLRYNLEHEGFDVVSASDGKECLFVLSERPIDLILLDWMLPDTSGIEICRRIRRHSETKNIPIIMLTARSEEVDKVRGLNAGADDYLSKPFSYAELTARINAVLRRIRPVLTEKVLGFQDVEMNLSTHKVTRNSVQLKLGPIEFRLLMHLMENPGRVYSRQQLIDLVWGHDIFIDERTVDVHIRRLRKGMNFNKHQSNLIRTVRSAGYSIDLPEGQNHDDRSPLS